MISCCFSGFKNKNLVDINLINELQLEMLGIVHKHLKNNEMENEIITRNFNEKGFNRTHISKICIRHDVFKDGNRLGNMTINNEKISGTSPFKVYNLIGSLIKSDKVLCSVLNLTYQGVDAIFMKQFIEKSGYSAFTHLIRTYNKDEKSCRSIEIDCNEKNLSLKRSIVFTVQSIYEIDSNNISLYHTTWTIVGEIQYWENCRLDNLQVEAHYTKVSELELTDLY